MTLPVIHQVEWGSGDVEVLKTFLTALFGWEFTLPMPGYVYYFCRLPEGPGVGLFQNPQAQPGGTPNVSVKVASIPVMLEKAQALGGTIAVPQTPLPGGSFAFIKAPEGNLIGLHQLDG